MKRLAACLATLAMMAGASAQGRDGPHDGHGKAGSGYANPSALIAAEIALHKLAQAKGLWKAYRENAAAGAKLLTPEPVSAEPWLKNRAEPASLPDWDPYAVWMSCDGTYGVVEGGWSEPGSSGLYATVWQRQGDGGYKWLIRQRIGHDQPVSAPDMLSAIVADCEPRGRSQGEAPSRPPQGKPAQPATPVDAQTGYSTDRSLYWRSGKDADGRSGLLVAIRKDGAMRTVLGDTLGSLPPND